MSVDAIEIELFKHRFAAIAEEMGEVLTRAAFSPNIKERRDHSCALFDQAGDMIAQAAHIPVHLGAAPLCVKAVIAAIDLRPSETAVVNDPYAGGTHLPDITLVTACAEVDSTGRPLFYVATRAHHADVGGITPGSLPPSTHIDEEGWRCAPQRLDDEVIASLLAASRTPIERRGDLAAQRAANLVGVTRLSELTERFGLERVVAMGGELQSYVERVVASAVRSLPDGEIEVEDALDDANGDGLPVRLVLRAEVLDDRLRLDFRESADAVAGPMNAPRAIVESAAFYVINGMTVAGVPANSGAMRCVEIQTREGSVLDPVYPSAVAAGNVETSQRVVDLILQALGRLAPGRFPACACGTMNNVLIGSMPGAQRPFVYYETIAGGYGGGPNRPGVSATQAHMTNTLNTPIEALEHAFPLRIGRYEIIAETGGVGRHPGGDGLCRSYVLLTAAQVTVIAERRRRGAPGAEGGGSGVVGRQEITASEGVTEAAAGKFSRSLEAGSVLTVWTPGGGGWGAV